MKKHITWVLVLLACCFFALGILVSTLNNYKETDSVQYYDKFEIREIESSCEGFEIKIEEVCLELGYTDKSSLFHDYSPHTVNDFTCIDSNNKVIELIIKNITEDGYVIVGNKSIKMNKC